MTGETRHSASGPSTRRAAGLAAVTSVSVVAVLFCLAVGALLILNRSRLVQHDPLNDPVLTELRARFVRTPDDESLKARIREEDLRARQAYFTFQERARTGAGLLLGGVLVLLASLSAVALLRNEAPDVAGFGPPPSERGRRRAARLGLAAGAALLLAAAVLAAVWIRRGESAGSAAINPEQEQR